MNKKRVREKESYIERKKIVTEKETKKVSYNKRVASQGENEGKK